jgi:hypothetical protein
MALIDVLIDGTPMQMDESLLVRTNGQVDNDNEFTTWVEYRLPHSDVIVHRSAHVTIKHWPGQASVALQSFGS